MEHTSPEESPTQCMLPEQVEEQPSGSGLVNYSLCPENYPVSDKKKRKESQKKGKKKIKQGNRVQFHSKVQAKTFYKKLKTTIEELELAHEEDYPLRNSVFAVKRRRQKEIMKIHHRCRPLTPRHIPIVKHIQETLQRENGNISSISHSQTLFQTKNSTQMNSSTI